MRPYITVLLLLLGLGVQPLMVEASAVSCGDIVAADPEPAPAPAPAPEEEPDCE